MLKDGVLTNVPFGWASGGNLTTLCPNGSKWVWEGLGECAQDARDMASIYLGLLSIFCFMMSSLPQYYSSCKTGNMDRALSIWFLLLWLGGDTCNLVGSFLADQLPLQTYTAVYYVLADLLMLAMYLYYKMKNRMAENRRVLHVMGLTCILGVTTSFANLPGCLTNQQEAMPSAYGGRTLLSSPDVGGSIVDKTGFDVNSGPMARGNDVTVVGHPKFTDAGQIGLSFTPKEIIGFSIGSVSSVLYLFSRLPQIYTNFKRKSTEGVSFFLFALVILGNTTYGLSVLLKNPDQGQGENSYVIHHLPWLIGSLGTLLLDLFISVQFISYRKASERLDTSSSETTPLMGS